MGEAGDMGVAGITVTEGTGLLGSLAATVTAARTGARVGVGVGVDVGMARRARFGRRLFTWWGCCVTYGPRDVHCEQRHDVSKDLEDAEDGGGGKPTSSPQYALCSAKDIMRRRRPRWRNGGENAELVRLH